MKTIRLLGILLVYISLVFLLSGCELLKSNEEKELTTVNTANYNNLNKTLIVSENRNINASINTTKEIKIIFLHHSTGSVIWNGGVEDWFNHYNEDNDTNYQITAQEFPKDSPYGWENYPYDYWNIWVNHAGDQEYLEEPTLEILTKQYDVIIWKHCYPVSSIAEDTSPPNINSNEKNIENYKLQYIALKNKMREFPNNKFIVWTGAALVQGETDSASAGRAQEFFNWVKNNWDETGDNIFIWDFWVLETEGGLYLKNEYATSPHDSHPNEKFAETVAPYFGQRIIDIIVGRGDINDATGKL